MIALELTNIIGFVTALIGFVQCLGDSPVLNIYLDIDDSEWETWMILYMTSNIAFVVNGVLTDGILVSPVPQFVFCLGLISHATVMALQTSLEGYTLLKTTTSFDIPNNFVSGIDWYAIRYYWEREYSNHSGDSSRSYILLKPGGHRFQHELLQHLSGAEHIFDIYNCISTTEVQISNTDGLGKRIWKALQRHFHRICRIWINECILFYFPLDVECSGILQVLLGIQIQTLGHNVSSICRYYPSYPGNSNVLRYMLFSLTSVMVYRHVQII